jgi:hypothetical protein
MRLHAALVALTLTLVSCASDDTTAPVTDIIIMPGVGSSYTFDGYELDISGAKVAGSEAQYVYNVVATNSTYRDRTGVWAVVRGSGSDSDTLYYSKDASENIWFLPGGGEAPFPWMRLPLATDGVTVETDTTVRSVGAGIEAPFITIATLRHQGTESIVVSGKSITIHKIAADITFKVSFFGQVQTETTEFTLWYAPSIGLQARVSAPARERNGSVENGDFEELISYSLK